MKLLIIDDDPISRAALSELSSEVPDLKCLEAASGQDAFSILRSGFKPDLCFLDLQMPEMSGLEVLQRFRSSAEHRNLRVVVTSASRDRKTIEALAKLQISGYVLKPFDAEKIKSFLQKPAVAPASSQKPQAARTRKYTLLMVDDDPVLRTVITEFVLATPDWDVRLAVDGEEAFELLYSGLRPDLVVTDLNMPRSDGISFISRIRRDRNFPNLRVAMLSGTRTSEHDEAVAALNLFAEMKKPVSPAELEALFNRIRRGLE